MFANYEQAIMQELERQRNERIREGWKEVRKKNPEMFQSQIPVMTMHFAPDKHGDEK